jgi:hypothetical protein
MTALPERDQVMAMVAEAIVAGARQERACEVISLSERTLQRWQNDRAEGACDRRPARIQTPKNKLDELERRRLLAIANSPEFGHLSPSQIVPRLVDQGEYVASESTFYRVLKAENQLKHVVPKNRRNRATSRVHWQRRHPASCSVGTLRIYRRRSWGSIFTCTCSWTSTAARSSAGRSMKRKAAPWQAR